MSIIKVLNVKSLKPDKILALALLLGFIFCLFGINWKQNHPDDMAFRPLFLAGKAPFNPGWFHKPPFHTYFNYFLSTLPIESFGKLFNIPESTLEFTKTVWSRILTSLLFLLSVILVFQIVLKSFGLYSARIVSLVFATSAGFIAYCHFLTADIPVMFWMLLAFYFSFNIFLRANLSDYVLAGFFTGIATATKYNGLAIGISIAVAHLLSCSAVALKSIDWRSLLLSKKIYLGLFMVVVGFVFGNPFCLLDYNTFKNDFLYNYIVTPVYDGQTGHSYWAFFWHVIEVIGLPSFLVCVVAIFFSLVSILRSKNFRIQSGTISLSLSVLLLYYFKFASFPRLETRFVLPLVPFFLLISGFLWSITREKKIVLPALVLLIGYNLTCNIYVGRRFLDDPRTTLQLWVVKNVPKNSSIESDLYTPSFSTPEKKFQEAFMPNVSGRERMFAKIFGNDPFILGSEADQKKEDERVSWYSFEKLMQRKPGFIVLNSLYYKRFTEPGIKHDLYLSVNNYFEEMLSGRYPYKIVFEKESKQVPQWVYPTEIDFLHNKVTVLARHQ